MVARYAFEETKQVAGLISVKKQLPHRRGYLVAFDDPDFWEIFGSMKFEEELSPFGIEIYSMHRDAREKVISTLRTNDTQEWIDIGWVDHVYYKPEVENSLLIPRRVLEITFTPETNFEKTKTNLLQIGLSECYPGEKNQGLVTAIITNPKATSADMVAAASVIQGIDKIRLEFDLIEGNAISKEKLFEQSAIKAIVEELEDRAKAYRYMSYGSLVLVIGVLIGGAVAFLKAGENVHNEVIEFKTATSKLVNDAKKDIDRWQSALNDLAVKIDEQEDIYTKTVEERYKNLFGQAEASIRNLASAVTIGFRNVAEVKQMQLGVVSNTVTAQLQDQDSLTQKNFVAADIDDDSDEELVVLSIDSQKDQAYDYNSYQLRAAVRVTAIETSGEEVITEAIDISRQDGRTATAQQIIPRVTGGKFLGIWAVTFDVDKNETIVASYLDYYSYDYRNRDLTLTESIKFGRSIPLIRNCKVTNSDSDTVVVLTSQTIRVVSYDAQGRGSVIQDINVNSLPGLEGSLITTNDSLICGNFVAGEKDSLKEAILILSARSEDTLDSSVPRRTSIPYLLRDLGAPGDIDLRAEKLDVLKERQQGSGLITTLTANELSIMNASVDLRPAIASSLVNKTINQPLSILVGHTLDGMTAYYVDLPAIPGDSKPNIVQIVLSRPLTFPRPDRVFSNLDIDGDGSKDLALSYRDSGGFVLFNRSGNNTIRFEEGPQFVPSQYWITAARQKPNTQWILTRRVIEFQNKEQTDAIADQLTQELRKMIMQPAPPNWKIPGIPRDIDQKFLDKLRSTMNDEKFRDLLEDQRTSADLTNIAIRIGILGVVFFLVQILVTTSRYMVRIAGFYDARADALKMGQDMSIDDFERLVSTLGPEALSFGKQPESPLQTIASTTHDTIQRTSGRSRR